MTYIRLFDFDVKHIPDNQNGAADSLSRRGKGSEDESDRRSGRLFRISIIQYLTNASSRSFTRVYLSEGEYNDGDFTLRRYLETLERPEGLSDEEYEKLRKKSRNFLIRDEYLFKRSRKRGLPPRHVVGLTEQRLTIIQELHDRIGHRGKQATFEQVRRRYQWKGQYEDVAEYVKTCEECQRRARNRYEEPLKPTWTIMVWAKIGVDVVYMPPAPGGYDFIVFARDDLSGWVEGRAIDDANSYNVAKFIYEDVICRHGCPLRIVMDRGSENLDLTKDLLEHYRIQQTIISAYHPQANGLVERGHDSIVNSLAKYSKQPGDWVKYLSLTLWADRISVRHSTGYSAFELVYGRECLLPVELSVASWSMIDWDEIETREDLILARMLQLDERTLELSQAVENLRNSRKANKAYFDQNNPIRPDGDQQLQVGDLVLLQNSQKFKSGKPPRVSKLDDRWIGPYRIREVSENSTFYYLDETDEISLG